MFKKLIQKIREKFIMELLLGMSNYIEKAPTEVTSDLMQNARNLMTLLACEGQFEIITEQVGEGINSNVPLPKVGSSAAHAFDLYTPIDVLVPAMSSVNVPIGRKFRLPTGYGAVLWSRSGLAAKLMIEKGAGLIDYDYGDEWIVVLRNHGPNNQSFKAGERICQAFLLPRYKVDFKEGKVALDNDRGGGIGSTGMS